MSYVWQIAEMLANAGPRGLYILEVTDIGDEYMYEFASFLKCLCHMQAKGDDFDDLNTKRLMEKLVRTLAKLEVMLPVHWNTITRNLLLLHPEWLDKFGAFWATHMLAVESLHVLIKQLCRSRKHMMASFLYHYEIFSVNQLSWRFTTEYANDPRPSAVSWKDAVEERRKGMHVLGMCGCVCVCVCVCVCMF
jgi:hypothetical protein